MHQISYFVYPENIDESEVYAELSHMAAQDAWEEGDGLYNPIRWLKICCDNYDEAKELIEKMDRGDYDNLAVKYKVCKGTSKTLEALKEREKKTATKLKTLEKNIHHKDVISKFVSCKKCESKINSAYISSNYCPMCHADLRPKSTIERLEKLQKTLKEIRQKIKEEEKKIARKNSEVKWLVKIEYHM